MAFLFANLPASARIPVSLVDNCTRLASEWQLYVLHSRSLRKVFLSIKGVYYQAEVMGQTVTWLVPYQFTQNVRQFLSKNTRLLIVLQIPSDVDVRVMLTFLELYQTLLGFVFFKLYADASLVYPPPLDAKKDDAAAGVGAFSLQEADNKMKSNITKTKEVHVDGKKVSVKDVRQTIKAISSTTPADVDVLATPEEPTEVEVEEEFVAQPSKTNPDEIAPLSTLQTLSNQQQSETSGLFSPYTFWLSRETSRPIFEFIVRSFGGRIGWPSSSGGGSPIEETDESITHVIIDRPTLDRPNETEEERELRSTRKYIQPQWVVDCINAGRIILEEQYSQGKPLPPHLSPFGEVDGAYNPMIAPAAGDQAMEDVDDSDDGEEDAIMEDAEDDVSAFKTAVAAADDPESLRVAELAAEAAGVDYGTFEKEVGKSLKKAKKSGAPASGEAEPQDMNKMLMSNKQRKLYERMKYGENKKSEEVRFACSSSRFIGCLLLYSARNWSNDDMYWRKRKSARCK